MIASKVCIIAGGVLSLFMAGFHSRFYKLFKWWNEFPKLNRLNQRIVYTIHMALLLLFLVFSFLSFVYTNELSQCTGLALGINVTYSIFWLWRTIWQIIYFHPPKIDGTRKPSFLHYFLILVFTLLFVAYAVPVALKIWLASNLK